MTRTKHNSFIGFHGKMNLNKEGIKWWQLANMCGLCVILITMIIFTKSNDS